MKKRAFGIVAALFALTLALVAGAYATDTETAELSAAEDVYALLYEDGTLVFQYGDTPESGKTVTKTYTVDLNAVYTGHPSNYAPWYDERKSVRVVNFADKISPSTTAYWFYECENLEHMDNIQNLDTTNVTSMYRMFWGCSVLTALDLSHFDTANVMDMRSMFSYCSGLTALDLSKFDTTNVTSMSGMFSGCSGLTALDLSKFDTTNVTSMSGMFHGCSVLTALDLSKFDTAKATTMRLMFCDCNALTVLDLSHFNTANVTDMSDMFDGCSGLTALDASKFDTANVTDMSNMFCGCSGLTVLDVSKFDTAKVTDMYRMFGWCSGLTTLDVSNFDTAKVTNMGAMFSGCSNLKTIYASDKFTTTSSSDMFYNCTSLIGGNGTKYNISHTAKGYARIDTASTPGYFTAKDAAPVYAIDALRVVKHGENAATLYVTLTAPGAATLSVAYFDENGKFISVELVNVTPDDGTQLFEIASNTKTLLATLLDGDCRTLCEPFSVGL